MMKGQVYYYSLLRLEHKLYYEYYDTLNESTLDYLLEVKDKIIGIEDTLKKI